MSDSNSNRGMVKGKGKVTNLESEKEGTPKRASGSSNSSRVRSRKRGSSGSADIHIEDELPLTPLSDTEEDFSRVDLFVQDNQVVVEHASEEVPDLEAVNQKETLNRFLAPLTCMCGVIAMGGVGFNLSLAQRRRNKLLESSTVLMIVSFFLFLVLWLLTWYCEDLQVLNRLKRLFYVGLAIVSVTLIIALVAMFI